MKPLMIRAVCLLLLLAMTTPAGLADRRVYVLDQSHSEINFVGEALLLSAHGFFERWESEVEYDPEKPENSVLKITIDAASINTRNERRDNHLRSADFFDVANHPKIVFAATQISRQDAQMLMVKGDLTVRGTTKQVEFPLKEVFFRDGRGRFKGELQLNRQEYGMSYNSRMNPIEDVVKVHFDINIMDKVMMEERQRQRQQPPAKPPANPPSQR